MNLNLKSLIAKLNPTCLNALNAAAELCKVNRNYDISLEHILLKLAESADNDLAQIIHHYRIDHSKLMAGLIRALDQLPTGNTHDQAISQHLPKLLQRALLLAAVEYEADKIRSGHLILTLLVEDDLSWLAYKISDEFERISVESLRKNLTEITRGSSENKVVAKTPIESGSKDHGSPASLGAKTQALDLYTIDLTARARADQLDPVLGRDTEIRQVMDILMRRRQNNPILTGEAGVGKTAVVEGFALRVAQGDVPPPLKNVSVRTLDLGLLQAGAGVKGEFENRLKSVIEEVKASPQPVILFIDEAHMMIGAGGQAGQSDAANLLKPALARGELRTIAATTWAEYKEYFEKDAALTRRFQVVKVEEPSEEQAIVMMRGLTESLEKHHQVRILDEAIGDAVRLSHRYLTGRQLPDKAISVLDTACARVAIGQAAIPPAIEDAQRRISQTIVEINLLKREAATGAAHNERISALKILKANEEERLVGMQAQWVKERDLITQIRSIHQRLEEGAVSDQSSDGQTETSEQNVADLADIEELKRVEQELEVVQAETPLMRVCVTSQTIADVIGGWTGIPVGKMLASDLQATLTLEDQLKRRIIGQPYALSVIGKGIRTARAGLGNPRAPVGVFLLVGPSGVGKTETALALADTLYGGERNLITINLSEFQEAHTVSTLKGSPPGYVGYGKGGVLTEAVRRKPYSVILFDEAEKAHPDVLELFYQVFDKGIMEDSEGREINFKNTVILLTSNACSDEIIKLCADPETAPEDEALASAILPELRQTFKTAFLNRLEIVPYYPLSDEVMRDVIKLKLEKIKQRLADSHDAEFSYGDDVITGIANRCKEVESGARDIDHILRMTVLPEVSSAILSKIAEGQAISQVILNMEENGRFAFEMSDRINV